MLMNGAFADFLADQNNRVSLKFKTKVADRTRNDGTKNGKIRVPFKYLNNFWHAFKMALVVN